MDTLDTAERGHDAPAGARQPTAAIPHRRRAGIALMLASSASNQAGAALGATAFPAIGPVGVVAVRQFVTAVVLTPIVRPRIRGLRRDQWWPILGLAVVFSVMNLSLYAAMDRVGLGLAVTLEFLGPLAVAVAGSRRVLDVACAVLAGVGVVVLTDPGPTTDVLGIALALLAATAWGCYILLNRTLGRRLPGLHGTAVAGLVTAAAWTPIAVAWFAVHTPTAAALALAVACGLMSSIVPYVADLLALRRVPAPVFSSFTSINPVWAALAGWLLLHQALDLHEWTGIGLIVISNVVVTARGVGTAVIADRPGGSAAQHPQPDPVLRLHEAHHPGADAAPDDAVGVEQLDVVEDLSAPSRPDAAVRPLVTDPGASATRSADQLHAAHHPLSVSCRSTVDHHEPPRPTSEPRSQHARSRPNRWLVPTRPGIRPP